MISLVHTSVITHSYKTFFFLVIRTFKIYFLSNFQTCSSHFAVKCMPVNYLFYSWKFVPFDPFQLFCLHPMLRSFLKQLDRGFSYALIPIVYHSIHVLFANGKTSSALSGSILWSKIYKCPWRNRKTHIPVSNSKIKRKWICYFLSYCSL